MGHDEAGLERYEVGSIRFPDSDYYDRHLVLDHVVLPDAVTERERFEAVARTLRDVLAQRWVLTQSEYDRRNPKQVYYLSLEFLMGRMLENNLANLGLAEFVRTDLSSDANGDWQGIVESEPDAGLGNGGLGRLAACFIDSMATLGLPAIGYGLRYDFGIFRQGIEHGRQVEHPDNWLAYPDPWEVARPSRAVSVTLGSRFELRGGEIVTLPGQTATFSGVPYDRPVVGYGGHTINTLRLWRAATADVFDFGQFSGGDFFGAVAERVMTETVTRVLYPDDSTPRGRSLRFIQEFFLVRCSLADIVRRFRHRGNEWQQLPHKVAIQLNDTHPAMAVAELMRILLDEAGLGWDESWDLTIRTLAYTNHTLLPEALEQWPVALFATLLPRHLEIIYEINRRFLDEVRREFPGDEERVARMSLIGEEGQQRVRMANLAIVGSHSTNGVAAIHTQLLRETTVRDFAEMYPERFSNKTNGITPRRWLLVANPPLADLITETIGPGWITDLSQLERLLPFADDAGFRGRFLNAKRQAKRRFVDWLAETHGIELDATTLFDTQIKRIHEYKRQLLAALGIVVTYNRLRNDPHLDLPPQTHLFAGKAAPAYHLAKVIIRLITSIGRVVNHDPAVRGRLRVEFLPNYSVSLAERLIPASDISEQISTAGYEASGTSNMKFMLNGALTVGTRDGATVEIAAEVGEENIMLFGLSADEVAGSRGWYSPQWHYHHEPEVRAALDLIFNNHFCHEEPGAFEPIREALLYHGDHYMHLADLASYMAAKERAWALSRDPHRWAAMAIRNVAKAGKFSSDRTIAEYARDIWHVAPCPVETACEVGPPPREPASAAVQKVATTSQP